MGSAELSRTTQTPMLGTFADVASAIGEVKEWAEASGRTEPLDFLCSYPDPSIHQPAADSDRHRQAFADMERAGVTWLIVSAPGGEPAATDQFLDAFGLTYLTGGA